MTPMFQIGSCLDNVLCIIAQSITRIMDKEISQQEDRFIVSKGICEELDRRKIQLVLVFKTMNSSPSGVMGLGIELKILNC